MATPGSRRDASDRDRERDRDSNNPRDPSPSPPPPTATGKHTPNYLKPTISSLHEGHDVCSSCKPGAKHAGCHPPSVSTGRPLATANKSVSNNPPAHGHRAPSRSPRTSLSPVGVRGAVGTAKSAASSSPLTRTPVPHLKPVVTVALKQPVRPAGKTINKPAGTKATGAALSSGNIKNNKGKGSSGPATKEGNGTGAGTQDVAESKLRETAVSEQGLPATTNAVTSDDHVIVKDNEVEEHENNGQALEHPQRCEQELHNADIPVPSTEEHPFPGEEPPMGEPMIEDLLEQGYHIHEEQQQPASVPQGTEKVVSVVEEEQGGASMEQTSKSPVMEPAGEKYEISEESTNTNRASNSSPANKGKVVPNAQARQRPQHKDFSAKTPKMDAELERKLLHRKAWESDYQSSQQQHASGDTDGSPSIMRDSSEYNSEIEDTASKLATEKRKNKVLALVGGFETAISLQESKTPWSPTTSSGAKAEGMALEVAAKKEERVADTAEASCFTIIDAGEIIINPEPDGGTAQSNLSKGEDDSGQV